MFDASSWTQAAMTSVVASWLLTLVIHSTIALGLAWILMRRLASLRLRDLAWKGALVIPLVTASVQIGFGVQPLAGSFHVGARSQVSAAPELAFPAADRQEPAITDLALSEELEPAEPAGADAVSAAPPPARSAGAVAPPPSRGLGVGSWTARIWTTVRESWAAGLLALWVFGALAGLMRLGVARLRLSRVLRPRRPVEDPELLRQLDRLRWRARLRRPVRLTWSAGVCGPVAFRREICLPKAALSRLSPAQLRAVLAHETAHVARRDSWWLLVTLVLERVFFFQPLYRIARRDLQALAEFLCDDWAVAQTGRTLTIAESLAEVAAWLSGVRRPVALPSIASDPSQLVRRVERILDGNTMFNTDLGTRPRFLRVATAIAVTVVMSVTAPGITFGAVREASAVSGGADRPGVVPATETSVDALATSSLSLETRAPEPRPAAVPEPQPVAAAADAPVSSDVPSTEPTEAEAMTSDGPETVTLAFGTPVDESSLLPQDTIDARVVASLTRALSDSAATVRREAAQALGQLKARAAVPSLIRGLDDDDADVRQAFVRALARIGDESAADGLIAALRDPSPAVRNYAAQAVGELGVRRAAPALIDLLGDEHPDLRRQAISQLWRLRDTSSVDAIARLVSDSSAAVRRTAVAALGQFRRPSSYPALERALSDDNAEVRMRALSSLARFRDSRSLAVFSRALADGSPDVRRAAVRALDSSNDSTVIPTLIEALQDSDARVRAAAVSALRDFDDVRSLTPFVRMLSDPSDDVREAVVRGLGELDTDEVITPLAATARSDSVADIRRTALAGLARFYRPTVVDPLVTALSDDDHEVRTTAARGIGRLAEYHGGRRAQSHASYAQMGQALPRTVAPLIAALRDDDSDVREAVARALGYLGDPRAVDPLIAALNDGASDVRKEAVYALGRIHDDRAVDPLIAVLEDADSEVRRAAVRTLSQFSRQR
jgi:HEAT repeat protein/beta-lactamase regulating signal transducer with metallopeptidase domain